MACYSCFLDVGCGAETPFLVEGEGEEEGDGEEEEEVVEERC